MSVDDRLREGLERSAGCFQPTVAGAEAAAWTARRRRTTRRLTGSAAVVVALAVGAVWVVDRDRAATAPPVPAATVPTTSTTLAPTTSASAAAVDHAADRSLAVQLAGTWTTRLVTPREATAAMVRTGTSDYREPVLAELRLPGTIRVTFSPLTYRVTRDGAHEDEGTWSVHDGRLVLVPSCEHCGIVLGPRLGADTLILSLLEDTSPDYRRVPDAAYATVLWTSAAFHRP